MVSSRKVSIVWVWALLAVLLSYSFDIECLVETQSCAQGIVHLERPSDCTQPGLTPTPLLIAVIPASPRVRIPAPRAISPDAVCWTVSDSPAQTSRSVPLGLRAPPLGPASALLT